MPHPIHFIKWIYISETVLVFTPMGAQWLSGRVLDSRQSVRGFEPHLRHCVVSLSKNINPSLVLVQPRNTRPFITERLLMGRKESNKKKWSSHLNHVYICSAQSENRYDSGIVPAQGENSYFVRRFMNCT